MWKADKHFFLYSDGTMVGLWVALSFAARWAFTEGHCHDAEQQRRQRERRQQEFMGSPLAPMRPVDPGSVHLVPP